MNAVVDLLEGGVDVERVARHVAGVDRLHARRTARRPAPGCTPAGGAGTPAGSRSDRSGRRGGTRRRRRTARRAARRRSGPPRRCGGGGRTSRHRRTAAPGCRRRVREGCRSWGVIGSPAGGRRGGSASSERTCSAISRPVASQSPDSPAMVSIRVSSARRRPRRPLRNGWMVRVKHEPCRWASVSSPVHSASAFAGVLDDSGAEQVGDERELLPVVERPRDRDLDDAPRAVARAARPARREGRRPSGWSRRRTRGRAAARRWRTSSPTSGRGSPTGLTPTTRSSASRPRSSTSASCFAGHPGDGLVEVAVVGDLVALVAHPPEQVGVALGGVARAEERRPQVVPLQQVEDARHPGQRAVRLVRHRREPVAALRVDGERDVLGVHVEAEERRGLPAVRPGDRVGRPGHVVGLLLVATTASRAFGAEDRRREGQYDATARRRRGSRRRSRPPARTGRCHRGAWRPDPGGRTGCRTRTSRSPPCRAGTG